MYKDEPRLKTGEKTPIMNTMRSIAALSAALVIVLFPAAAAEPAPSETETSAESAPLPQSFRNFSLGMSIDELKAKLIEDSYFSFRGDPDVSYLPVTQQNLVESTGSSFIKRAFFQLKDNAVFVMSFTMNTTLIDHYSIFTTFVQKYGQPRILTPKEAIWESDTVRVSIERPLTVKYIDKRVFDGLVESSRALRSTASEMREEFLDNF